MKLVAVTTVRDPGAAEVAREALSAHGVPVELKRLGVNPYFGSLGVEIEVRVPPDRVGEARAILEHLEEEAEAAAAEQALDMAPAEPAQPAAVPPGRRTTPRNVATATVLLAAFALPAVLLAAYGVFYLLTRVMRG